MTAATPPSLTGVLTGREYADLNVTYGWRGGAVTAGIMKSPTGGPGSGWYVYVGGGLSGEGLSVSLTASLNSVSTGWNAGFSRNKGGTSYQVGLDAAGTPFTEAGVGVPSGEAAVAYHVWRLGGR